MQRSHKPRNFEDILSRLPDARQNGDNWTASCPAPGHQTPAGHLTLKDTGDKALVTCQGGRHSYPEICESLGFAGLAYNSVGGYTAGGQRCETVKHLKKHPDSATKTAVKHLTPPMITLLNSVNLSALAEAKRLPVEFLESLGVRNFPYKGESSVRIPYYSEDGQELAVRFRLALSGDSRFVWRKGDHTLPYGLNMLTKIRKEGWVVVVEGESDCWTAWLHDIPALGAPGKAIWPSSWGEHLKGLEVYVWQEPEAEDFPLLIMKSVDDLRVIRAPEGIKDISEAHVQGQDIPALIAELKAKAESGHVLKARYDNEQLAQLYREAKPVIEAEDPLELVKDVIKSQGYGGDRNPPLITYLAATSRLLQMHAGGMPVHLLLTGLSSTGKSYTMTMIKRLLPDEAYHTIDAGSPRTIIYDDADLQHRVLIFGEADSLPAGEDNPAASAIRNLLQDHRLKYEVTVKDGATGAYGVQKVDKPGPTVLITTSTRSLGAQLMTRLFTLEISDSKAQNKASLETQAVLEIEGSEPLDGAFVAFQHYLQLKAPIAVVVPFARELAGEMGKMALTPRISRDFARLMSFIKSVAILRHHRRETDDKGRLVATRADYHTVRQLVNEMYVDSSMGVTSELRALVEAVKMLHSTGGDKITNTMLANHLGTGVMQITRRAKRAIKQGWLVNQEQRKHHPANYAPGEPMPETEGLPLLSGKTFNTFNTFNNGGVKDSRYENQTFNSFTPLTDGNTPPTDFPCIKGGEGSCMLRTDASLPFQCNEPPGRCQFLIPQNNPAHASPEADTLLQHPSHPSPGEAHPSPASAPTEPCYACGGVDFWVTDWGSRLCQRCHPKPGGEHK